MTCDGSSLLLEVFLVRLVSQLKLFMSFLFPRSHISFLILLSCHHSTLRSHHFVGPSTSPFVLCLNDLFSQMISCWWELIRSVDQDLSLHLAFLCIIWWDEDVTSCMFFSRQPLFDFCWLLVDEMLFIGAVDLSSSIHDEWAVSSFHKVIGVHHVPCFIFDLNSSRDLPKFNWEFPAGVSPTKYPISTKAYYRLKNQSRHHV